LLLALLSLRCWARAEPELWRHHHSFLPGFALGLRLEDVVALDMDEWLGYGI
jgi:hypothetical protein